VEESTNNACGGLEKESLVALEQSFSFAFIKLLFFVSGFSKSEKANITTEDLAAFRHIAKSLLTNEVTIAAAVVEGKLIEVSCEETATIS
jgi:hypothetical protein